MKVLIAYGTRYGSTTEIANKIGKVLGKNRAVVDIINLHEKKVKDVSAYDLVVVGSGIKMGSWTRKAVGFLERFETDLAGRKVAFFVSCMDAHYPEKRKEAHEKYLKDIARRYPHIEPCKFGLFGGVIDVNRYGFGARLIMKGLAKEFEKDGIDVNKPNDFRDWDEIEKWAGKLIDDCRDQVL